PQPDAQQDLRERSDSPVWVNNTDLIFGI
ncbi:hypothetical protein WJX79_009768, partial [Trebouxia sp. C0005]